MGFVVSGGIVDPEAIEEADGDAVAGGLRLGGRGGVVNPDDLGLAGYATGVGRDAFGGRDGHRGAKVLAWGKVLRVEFKVKAAGGDVLGECSDDEGTVAGVASALDGEADAKAAVLAALAESSCLGGIIRRHLILSVPRPRLGRTSANDARGMPELIDLS
jgi:hypothetical protein